MLSRKVSCVATACLLLTTWAHAQQRARVPVPSWVKVPIPAASAPTNPQERQLQDARALAFNDKSGMKLRLDEAAKLHVYAAVSETPAPRPMIPANSSDAIVVGTIKRAQPFLSADHSHVFTVLKFQVEQIVKDKSTTAKPEGTIDLVEDGGTLLINGQVLKYPVIPYVGHVDVGYRYLTFLHFDSSAKAFRVTRAWLLADNRALPIDPVKPGDETVAQVVALDEQGFIGYVQRAVAAHIDQ